MLRNNVNYKVYPSSADSKMKDIIFMKIVETSKSSNNKLYLNNYCFEVIYFYKVEIYYSKLSVV